MNLGNKGLGKIRDAAITHPKIPVDNSLALLCDCSIIGLIPSVPLPFCWFCNFSLGGELGVRTGFLCGQGHRTNLALGMNCLRAKPLSLHETSGEPIPMDEAATGQLAGHLRGGGRGERGYVCLCFTKGVRPVNRFLGCKKWDKAISGRGDRICPSKEHPEGSLQPGKCMGSRLPDF